MFRMGCLLLAATTFSLVGQPARAAPKDKYVFKFETMATSGTPWYRMYKRFIRRVKKESKGRIQFKQTFGSPLGEKTIAKRCVDGTVDACGVTVGALSTIVKDLAVLELPFLFLDVGEADRILDGPALPQVKKILAANNLTFYCWAENGWRSFGTKNKPIRKPADLKGLSMRAMENKLHEEMYLALKAKPVPLNLPDVAEALKKDQVVGFDQSPIYLTAASWDKHIKHFTLTRHIYQPAVVAFNKTTMKKLPKDLMHVILSSSKDVQTFGRKAIRAVYEPLIKNLEQQGVKVVRLTPAQRVPFIWATKRAHIKVYRKASRRARKLLDIIYKAKQKKKGK